MLYFPIFYIQSINSDLLRRSLFQWARLRIDASNKCRVRQSLYYREILTNDQIMLYIQVTNQSYRLCSQSVTIETDQQDKLLSSVSNSLLTLLFSCLTRGVSLCHCHRSKPSLFSVFRLILLPILLLHYGCLWGQRAPFLGLSRPLFNSLFLRYQRWQVMFCFHGWWLKVAAYLTSKAWSAI